MGERGGYRCLAEERGQSTVEYALVLGAFLAMAAALAALWRLLGQGAGADIAAMAASHGLGAGTVAALQDVLLY